MNKIKEEMLRLQEEGDDKAANYRADQCVIIADQRAIRFAEWISNNRWYEQSVKGYWCKDSEGYMKAITTEELLKEFDEQEQNSQV